MKRVAICIVLIGVCLSMTSCYRTCTFNYMHWVHENSDSVNVVRDTVFTGKHPHVIIRDTVLDAVISIRSLEEDNKRQVIDEQNY